MTTQNAVSCPYCGESNSKDGGQSCSHLVARTTNSVWEDEVIKGYDDTWTYWPDDQWLIRRQFLRSQCKEVNGLVFSQRASDSLKERILKFRREMYD